MRIILVALVMIAQSVYSQQSVQRKQIFAHDEKGRLVRSKEYWKSQLEERKKLREHRKAFTQILTKSVGVSVEEVKAYPVPLGSEGNVIELNVSNSLSSAISKLSVQAAGIPTWMRLTPSALSFSQVGPGEQCLARFSLALDRTAPLDASQTISFLVSSEGGQRWSRQMKIKVAPPQNFELYQNFPNPFNPSTTIAYQITTESRVSLKIFNVLGQEVATVVDGDRLAGYHQEMWDATRYSSGMYVYQLIATDEKGHKQITRKRMMLLK